MAKRRTTLTVTGSEWLNKHMVRIRLGGPGFDEFVPNEFTDAYVKIVFEQDGGADGRSAGSAPVGMAVLPTDVIRGKRDIGNAAVTGPDI